MRDALRYDSIKINKLKQNWSDKTDSLLSQNMAGPIHYQMIDIYACYSYIHTLLITIRSIIYIYKQQTSVISISISITKASKVSTQFFGLVCWFGPFVLLTGGP